MNRAILVGRLTNDAELKVVTEEGRSLLTFTLAVKRNYPNSNNEIESDFIPVVFWKEEEKAKMLQNYLLKGRMLSVEGRISVRKYENKDGQKRYITQIIADEISFLDKMKGKEATGE